ncbi:MAG: hypothetical protein ABEI98_03630 [Halorhabdus sp.]
MADRNDAFVFLSGVVAGAGLAIGIVEVFGGPDVDTPFSQTAARGPQLTTHTVVRDDQGRIETVETVQGLPLGAAAPGSAVGGQGETVVIEDARE